jgi:peptidoglycan/LPS O-acetylase OafA/YrhL
VNVSAVAAALEPAAVPDAVAPPPRHPRFPLIDGMRALAVLSVIGVHSALMGGAFGTSLAGRLLAHLNIGVTIFFLISGFLLYRPMIAHRSGGAAAPATSQYAKRRFLRIYPAYWVILATLAVIPGVTGVVGGNWWPMAAMVQTLPVYHGARCVDGVFTCGLAQTWSLTVEATFYLALPIYAWLAAGLTRGMRLRTWIATELSLLAVLSAGSIVAQFSGSHLPPAWLGGSVLGFVFWFALGMGMAIVSVGLSGARLGPRARRMLRNASAPLWVLAGAIYLGMSLWLPQTPFLFVRDQVLVAHLWFGVIAALLIAPAVFGSEMGGLPRRLLAHPVAAWLGLISYGMFLWHYVVAQQLGSGGAKESFPLVLVGTLAVTIALAAASYYLVERPLLRLKYRRLSLRHAFSGGREELTP